MWKIDGSQLMLGACLLASLSSNATANVLTFSEDPHWKEVGNRHNPQECFQASQRFKWQSANRAGGKAAGEVGGALQRTIRKTFYAARVDGARYLTSDDRLQMTAKLNFPSFGGGANLVLGWFKSSSVNFPPAHLVGIRIVDLKYPSSYPNPGAPYQWLNIYGATWDFRAFGTQTRKPGAPPNLETEIHVPIGPGSYTISIDYQPNGANGKGSFELSLNGDKKIYLPMDPINDVNKGVEFRKEGAKFDRFGIYSAQSGDGQSTELYIDDLEYTAICADGQPCLRRESFDSDPGWDGANNDTDYPECRRVTSFDFGYSPETNFATQAGKGEIGGYIARTEPDSKPIYYARGLQNSRSLHDRLRVRGSMSLVKSGTDSAVSLGWFREETAGSHLNEYKEDLTPYKPCSIPRNFFGFVLEWIGNKNGAYARPFYALDSYDYIQKGGNNVPVPCFDSIHTTGSSGLARILIDPTTFHEWDFSYDPKSSNEAGVITFTTYSRDGTVRTMNMPVPIHHKDLLKGADHFGIMPVRAGGSPIEVYFDNLAFTELPQASLPASLPASLGEVYAFPNPAKGEERPTVHVETSGGTGAELKIYDARGHLLHREGLTGPPGTVTRGGKTGTAYEWRWDPGPAGSGVYVYTVEVQGGAGAARATGKFVLIR